MGSAWLHEEILRAIAPDKGRSQVLPVFIWIQKPKVLNKVAVFIVEVENQLHDCQELSHLSCLRVFPVKTWHFQDCNQTVRPFG